MAQQLRFPLGRGESGETLRTLEEHQVQKEELISKDINNNVEKHIRWNEGYVDKTASPLTPEMEPSVVDRSQEYRKAMPATIYLPTPPASVSDEENQDVDMPDADLKDESRVSILFGFASSDIDDKEALQFRRRVARGGRICIDRKKSRGFLGMRDPRFEFDNSDDDDDDVSLEESAGDGPETFPQMHYRAHLYWRVKESEAQAQAQAARRAASVESGPIAATGTS